jgi:uncharacterized protein
MRVRLAAMAVGAVFGATLSWTGLSSPDVIRDGLLFRSSYLFLVFGSAVATAFVGLRLLRSRRERALLVDKPVRWRTERPERRHLVGGLMFGVGWAVCDACPGPIATQLGQGIAWSLFTIAGVLTGVIVYLRRQRERAPAARPAPPSVEASPVRG